MPSKRKRRVKSTTVKKKVEETKHVYDYEEDISPETEEARSTIERLSKKYLHKSPNTSANNRGAIDALTSKENISYSEDSSFDSTQGKKIFSLHHRVKNLPKTKPKRLHAHNKKRCPPNTTAPKESDQSVSKTVSKLSPGSKECTLKLVPLRVSSLLSPEFKVPRPTLGHSTPSNVCQTPSNKDNSLFGFEEFDTPLGLSPVISEMDSFSPSRSLSVSPKKNVSRRSLYKAGAVYNVPSEKARKKRMAKKNTEFSSSEVNKWVSELNQQFDEVDQFELAVE